MDGTATPDALLWNEELANLERVIAAAQFQKEYLYLRSKPTSSFSVPELKGITTVSRSYNIITKLISSEWEDTLMWYQQRVQESSKEVAEVTDLEALNNMANEVRDKQAALYIKREGTFPFQSSSRN